MLYFRTIASKHESNAMASFQTTTIGKTRDKYFLLFFIRRNEIGLLTSFTKIDKRRGLTKV